MGKPAYKKYGAPTKSKWSVEVDNLSSRCSWQDLKDFMRKAGEVCYGAAHGDVGKNKGVVCYDRKEDAERAVDELDGRAVTLKFVVRDDWETGSVGRSRSRSPRRSRSPPPRRSRSRSRSRSGRKDSRSRSRSRTPDKKSRRSRSRSRSDSR